MLDPAPSLNTKEEQKFLLRTTPKVAEFIDSLMERTQLPRNTIIHVAMRSFLDEKKNDIQGNGIFHVKEKESTVQFIRMDLSLWDEAQDFVYRYYNYTNHNISLNSLIHSSLVALSKMANPLELFEGMFPVPPPIFDIVLHPQLKERLERAASENGTSLYEEIHQRLLSTLEFPPLFHCEKTA